MGTGLTAATLSMGLPAESATAGAYAAEVASQTPMLAWNFDEQLNPGGQLAVASIDNMAALGHVGFGNGAIIGGNINVGVPSMTPGTGFAGFSPGNTAFNFNTSGSGSVVTTLIQPEAGTPHGMEAGSISMWVNATDPNAGGLEQGVLWRGDEGGGSVLNLRMIDDVSGVGSLSLRLQAGEVDTILNDTSGVIDYSDGQWHHVAATWAYDVVGDAGILNLHVDGGSLVGGESVSTAFDSISYPQILEGVGDVIEFDFRSRLGKGRVNSMRYSGDMDDPAIWDRQLSAQEVADQYNAAFVPEPASLMLLAGAVGCVSLRRSKD